ncbi:DUF2069 domain-containing protein [Marinihelvus fidelis]|uniref:DUF2069 domain-containing protein n=1 Tax=Marinihelvus fidelis TaxID=2613842 RepID=A0A5N0T3E8_9GAMM|nr:DUF2069 domain-containing protein [Marinihelvus fidelis]KAA9129595.1 DUF2069 domain-containing protein [Marinihelvus fidelis]
MNDQQHHPRRKAALQAARVLYVMLLAWQPLWLAVIPAPAGKQAWPLALLATVPLLLPLPGVLARRPRALVWAGYLALLYFMFGVMEWWSAANQQWTAGVETLLASTFLVALAVATRKQRRKRQS